MASTRSWLEAGTRALSRAINTALSPACGDGSETHQCYDLLRRHTANHCDGGVANIAPYGTRASRGLHRSAADQLRRCWLCDHQSHGDAKRREQAREAHAQWGTEAQTLLHGGAPHLGLEALSELVVPPMLIVVVPVTLPPIAMLPRSAWTLTAPRPTKKVTATKTASAIPAMAAESLSQRGTPSSTLTWTKVGLSAGPAC